jgi:hypothetical protein
MSFWQKIFLVFVFLLAGVFSSQAQASTPDFLVSWKAQTSAPFDYLGKNFPVNKSVITVSFELIGTVGSQKGKVLDMTDKEVRWYVNGKLMAQDNNKKTFSFITADDDDSSTDVKISAEYFDPDVGYSYFVNKYISIPLSHPHVVLNSISGGSLVSIGSGIRIFAAPYFFNTPLKNLIIQWVVNGKEIETDVKDPWNLDVNVSSDYKKGSSIEILATVRNIFNPLEEFVQKKFILNTE